MLGPFILLGVVFLYFFLEEKMDKSISRAIGVPTSHPSVNIRSKSIFFTLVGLVIGLVILYGI